ncbi:hypothetical protein CEXT_399371 [Caerostris extrusa]|uniref:Uncharacterized protein n=1 Tax=Caerostris extrusa TaxID=172846 RepID=A0AAV4QSC8_CAEEX|nr:hypothetical protein CEXT_399371 [Caerostris extrusa]
MPTENLQMSPSVSLEEGRGERAVPYQSHIKRFSLLRIQRRSLQPTMFSEATELPRQVTLNIKNVIWTFNFQLCLLSFLRKEEEKRLIGSFPHLFDFLLKKK